MSKGTARHAVRIEDDLWQAAYPGSSEKHSAHTSETWGTQMSISDEAVEAAAIAISECASVEEWEGQRQNFKNAMRREARRAIEAAAPYFMTQTAGAGE